MSALSGQRVVVTGASSGIGMATARCLGARGAHLALLARRRQRLEAEAGRIRAGGGIAHAVACDLASEAAIEAAVASANERLGGIDACVFAAGVAAFAPLAETETASFDEQIAINLRGPFLLTRAILPHLSAGATLVFVLSVAVDTGFPGCTAYGASKAGVKAMGLALREELRPRGIRVALITPGATDTALWDRLGGDFDRAKMLAAEDVAEAIATAVAASPRAAVETVVLRPVGGDL